MSSSLLVFTNPCIKRNSGNPLTSLQQIYIYASQFLFWIRHDPVTSVPKTTDCGLITALLLFSFLFAVTGLGVGVVFSVLFFKRKFCFRRLNAGIFCGVDLVSKCFSLPPRSHVAGPFWFRFGTGHGVRQLPARLQVTIPDSRPHG